MTMPLPSGPYAGIPDREKQAAARASLEYVEDGFVVGLGSGSTAEYAIRLLAERVRDGENIRGIPTSRESAALAASLGIPLTSFDEVLQIDVTIDGADEIDPALNLVKGAGGALLREKIVASASRRVVIVADSSKTVTVLGSRPLPVEVVPFAEPLIAHRLAGLGAEISLRGAASGEPFVTDEGHLILDCRFGRIDDPFALASELDRMPGVVEHGLFLGMADVVLVGENNSVTTLRRDESRAE